MTDDIRTLTAALAADPASLVFLRLGEALRARGQLEAARRVAATGLQRYPDLADAHDLLGRIHGDERDFERAFDAWDTALRLEPGHAGAHKGIGFLYFVAGDLQRATEHLARAADALPDDAGVQSALARVQEAASAPPAAAAPPSPPRDPSPAPASPPPAAPSPVRAQGGDGMVIADARGQRLGGLLTSPAGLDLTDAVAAAMQGVAREAGRAADMLGLGRWSGLSAEGGEGGMAVVPVSDDAVLMLVRGREVPLARLGGLARRAAGEARAWLEAPA